MALRDRQYIEQPMQPAIEPKKKHQALPSKRRFLTKEERVIYLSLIVVAAIMCVMALHRQGEIQTATIDIQKVENSISVVNQKNVDLKVQVSEKSTFERIMEKAKEQGLTPNEKNVKVVPGE